MPTVGSQGGAVSYEQGTPVQVVSVNRELHQAGGRSCRHVELDVSGCGRYRGTPLMRNRPPPGPYSRPMISAIWC
jgi:hypothetical protein